MSDVKDERVISALRMLEQATGKGNAKLIDAVECLFRWVPECHSVDGVEEGTPFMSEAYLYELLGKLDARTLLALVREVITSAGIDRMTQWLGSDDVLVEAYIQQMKDLTLDPALSSMTTGQKRRVYRAFEQQMKLLVGER